MGLRDVQSDGTLTLPLRPPGRPPLATVTTGVRSQLAWRPTGHPQCVLP